MNLSLHTPFTVLRGELGASPWCIWQIGFPPFSNVSVQNTKTKVYCKVSAKQIQIFSWDLMSSFNSLALALPAAKLCSVVQKPCSWNFLDKSSLFAITDRLLLLTDYNTIIREITNVFQHFDLPCLFYCTKWIETHTKNSSFTYQIFPRSVNYVDSNGVFFVGILLLLLDSLLA